MTYYNTPTGNQTNGLYEIFQFIGVDTTAGLFWGVMLVVIWVVSFLSLKGYSSSRAWTFSSFFCAILGMMMAVMDFMNPKFMYLFIFFTAIGFVWLKLEGDNI